MESGNRPESLSKKHPQAALDSDLPTIVSYVVENSARSYMDIAGINIAGVFCCYYWLLLYYECLELRRIHSASYVFYNMMMALYIKCYVVKGKFRPWYRYYEEVETRILNDKEWNMLHLNGIECFVS